MKNMTPFQIFALAAFGVFAIIAVILLSTFEPREDAAASRYGDRVLIWGTFEPIVFTRLFGELANTDDGFAVADYERIDARNFNETLVNAIAEGRSPDLVILPSSELVRQRSKLQAISYDMIPLRQFRDMFIDGAEIFARPDGIYALPFAVDPIVLYWNRDLFASGGFAQAPTSWEYITNTVVPSLTLTDNQRNIRQSAIAFGEFRNVLRAKETLLTLALQTGSRMIYEDAGRYVSGLNQSVGDGLPPFTSAIQFFTNFSNPNNLLYTWNRQQQLDRNAFVAGDLAMYFGYGSEASGIIKQNPNLNFDVAVVPQGASATVRRTYGEYYGLAIPKASSNPQGAYLLANKIVSPTIADRLTSELEVTPVQRELIARGSSDSIRQIIYDSALIAYGWLDPGDEVTDNIFQTMIEAVTSGQDTHTSAASDAITKIRLAF